jgi:peptide/nickel transport system substrate-binding protein
VKGKNPFKDRRVRLALYQSLDVDAINRVVMRGLGRFPATVICPIRRAALAEGPGEALPSYDSAAAKKLLPRRAIRRRLRVELDCQNVRETVCTRSRACSPAGGRAREGELASPTRATSPRARPLDTSMYLLGWGGPNTDRDLHLQAVIARAAARRRWRLQLGQLQGRAMDAAIDRVKVEMDPAKRQAAINEAIRIQHEQVTTSPSTAGCSLGRPGQRRGRAPSRQLARGGLGEIALAPALRCVVPG